MKAKEFAVTAAAVGLLLGLGACQMGGGMPSGSGNPPAAQAAPAKQEELSSGPSGLENSQDDDWDNGFDTISR